MHVTPFEFFPTVLLALTLVGAWGTRMRMRSPGLVARDHGAQFTALQAAVLALLGLLLGFSFSMAVGRYDERKRTQVDEANAISTSYLRIGTIDPIVAVTQRRLMLDYVGARLAFFEAGENRAKLAEAANRTATLQARLWSNALTSQVPGQREGYANYYLITLTNAFDAAERRRVAFENRIPATAWTLLLAVAGIAAFLVGMGSWRWNLLLLAILPFIVSATLTLVYDIDSPRSGLIRVHQESIERVQQLMESDR